MRMASKKLSFCSMLNLAADVPISFFVEVFRVYAGAVIYPSSMLQIQSC